MTKENIDLLTFLLSEDSTMDDIYHAGQAAGKLSKRYQQGAEEEDFVKFSEAYHLMSAINAIGHIKFGHEWESYMENKFVELLMNFGAIEKDPLTN